MTKYYSNLPWISIGPFELGSQVAEDVGRCSAAGVRLEGGECLPEDGFLEVSTRTKMCSRLGAESLHADGTSCVFQEKAICALAGGSRTSATSLECDVSKMIYDEMAGANLGLSMQWERGKISVGGVTGCPDFPPEVSARLQANFADGTCVLEIPPVHAISDLLPACESVGDGTCVIPMDTMLNAWSEHAPATPRA